MIFPGWVIKFCVNFLLSLQMKTGCVALVLCLNISVDPPDVIKISPCARMECWIGIILSCHSVLILTLLCELHCDFSCICLIFFFYIIITFASV